MTLEDVDHLEAPRMIAEEDHITLERKAANVGAQLGSRPAYRSFERSQLVTLPAQIPHESLCGGDAAALFGIAKNFEKIGAYGSEERRLPHGPSPLARNSMALAAMAASSSSSETSPPAAIDASIFLRSAASFASRSSTRRSPSRTTSLAEP